MPTQPRWSSPKVEKVTCAPDPMNPDPAKQSTVAVSYLLQDITDLQDSFVLQVTINFIPFVYSNLHEK